MECIIKLDEKLKSYFDSNFILCSSDIKTMKDGFQLPTMNELFKTTLDDLRASTPTKSDLQTKNVDYEINTNTQIEVIGLTQPPKQATYSLLYKDNSELKIENSVQHFLYSPMSSVPVELTQKNLFTNSDLQSFQFNQMSNKHADYANNNQDDNDFADIITEERNSNENSEIYTIAGNKQNTVRKQPSENYEFDKIEDDGKTVYEVEKREDFQILISRVNEVNEVHEDGYDNAQYDNEEQKEQELLDKTKDNKVSTLEKELYYLGSGMEGDSVSDLGVHHSPIISKNEEKLVAIINGIKPNSINFNSVFYNNKLNEAFNYEENSRLYDTVNQPSNNSGFLHGNGIEKTITNSQTQNYLEESKLINSIKDTLNSRNFKKHQYELREFQTAYQLSSSNSCGKAINIKINDRSYMEDIEKLIPNQYKGLFYKIQNKFGEKKNMNLLYYEVKQDIKNLLP